MTSRDGERPALASEPYPARPSKASTRGPQAREEPDFPASQSKELYTLTPCPSLLSILTKLLPTYLPTYLLHAVFNQQFFGTLQSLGVGVGGQNMPPPKELSSAFFASAGPTSGVRYMRGGLLNSAQHCCAD